MKALNNLRKNCEKVKHAQTSEEQLKPICEKHADQLRAPDSENVMLQVPKWAEKAKKEKLANAWDIIFTNLTPEEREGQHAKDGLCKWQAKINDKNGIKNRLKKAHPPQKK